MTGGWLRAKDLEAAKKVYLRYELTRTRVIVTLGKSPDEEARVAAALALGDARDEATVKALGLALTDRSRRVRRAMVQALGSRLCPEGPVKAWDEPRTRPSVARSRPV